MVRYDHKTKYILVFNAGSSSLKWALFTHPDLEEMARGAIEYIGQSKCFSEARILGKLVLGKDKIKSHRQGIAYVLKLIAWHQVPLINITNIAHRVVHGGHLFTKPTKLSKSVLARISQFNSLAPLHNPPQLEVATLCLKLLPQAKNWAVFDTAWFADLPEFVKLYALPIKFQLSKHLRRYGFHGISHQFVSAKASHLLDKDLEKLNLVTCHLGNGASITAVRQGRPCDTSMGFTPLEGLVMGTRSGDVDPGLILHLIDNLKIKPAQVKKLLEYESGIKGVAGIQDMREILVRAGYEVLGYKSKTVATSQDRQLARLALRMFIYRAQKYIGAYASILGKVDAIVFTGAIGERNETIRNLIMRGLRTWQSVPVLVIPTNEELAIAREIVKL
ncbi:MAG: acetate/propionate family kinase [Patescibacteria group bacterium]